MPFSEFSLYLVQQGMDFAFGKGHDLRADFDGPLPARRAKWPNEHSRAVRLEDGAGAHDGNGFHQRGIMQRAD
jgi:hypothetical protein